MRVSRGGGAGWAMISFFSGARSSAWAASACLSWGGLTDSQAQGIAFTVGKGLEHGGVQIRLPKQRAFAVVWGVTPIRFANQGSKGGRCRRANRVDERRGRCRSADLHAHGACPPWQSFEGMQGQPVGVEVVDGVQEQAFVGVIEMGLFLQCFGQFRQAWRQRALVELLQFLAVCAVQYGLGGAGRQSGSGVDQHFLPRVRRAVKEQVA